MDGGEEERRKKRIPDGRTIREHDIDPRLEACRAHPGHRKSRFLSRGRKVRATSECLMAERLDRRETRNRSPACDNVLQTDSSLTDTVPADGTITYRQQDSLSIKELICKPTRQRFNFLCHVRIKAHTQRQAPQKWCFKIACVVGKKCIPESGEGHPLSWIKSILVFLVTSFLAF